MKEGTPMSNHLNEFSSIYNHLIAQEVNFLESMKVLFLLITLPDSWETFRTTINTSQAVGGVTSSLLTKEINRKNNDSARGGGGSALMVRGRDKGKEKVQEPRSKSKTHCIVKGLKCYHCGKKGHLCKNCRSFKKENEIDRKGKKKAEGELSGKKEKVNTIRDDNGSE